MASNDGTQQEWYTAKELAGLPGMPGTERRAREKAKREDWAARKRSGYGGGNEYHIGSLPRETRDALLDRMIETLPETTCRLPSANTETTALEIARQALPRCEQLADWQRRTMDARLALLREIERLTAVSSGNQAIAKIVARAKLGELPAHLQSLVPVANARSGGQLGKQTLSERTLKRWRADLAKLGPVALAPREPARDRTMPAWGPALLKAWRRPQKPTLADAVRQLNTAGVDVNYSQARRFLEKVGEIEKNRGRMGAKDLKSIKPFRRRDTSNLLPGDIYAADGHTFDAEVAHPDHGRPFRPEVTLILDVATRVTVGWSVDLAESTLATIDALRHACEAYGVPAIFYTDNGSGYCNQILTEPGTGMLARLGITHQTSLPYNSQARGVIERAHRSILVKTAQRLPTYIGAPMDQDARKVAFKDTRGEIRRLLIDWADFVRLIEAAIEEYHHRPHRGLPKFRDPATGTLRHQTPAEAWQQHVDAGWQMTPAGELPDIYHPQASRRVNRCEVVLFGNRYFSGELAEWHGETVFIAFDMRDAAKVWVRDQDQRLICVAELGANSSDFMPLSKVEQGREKRADGRLARLDRKREEIEMERHGGRLPGTVEVNPEQEEARRALEVEMQRPKAPGEDLEIPPDPKGRYRLCRRMERDLAQGRTFDARTMRFYNAFTKSKEYRIFRETEETLGGGYGNGQEDSPGAAR